MTGSRFTGPHGPSLRAYPLRDNRSGLVRPEFNCRTLAAAMAHVSDAVHSVSAASRRVLNVGLHAGCEDGGMKCH